MKITINARLIRADLNNEKGENGEEVENPPSVMLIASIFSLQNKHVRRN